MEVKSVSMQNVITTTKNVYVAVDGKVFERVDDCICHEHFLDIEQAKKEYGLERVYDYRAYSFNSFTYKSGNQELFQKMMTAMLAVWNICSPDRGLRAVSNIDSEDYTNAFKKLIGYDYKENGIYFIGIHHVDMCDSYDTFEVEIKSEDDYRKEIKKINKWFTTTFGKNL
jgi:hypothetical protein